MLKVLFIPLISIQAELCAAIVKQFKGRGLSYSIICLDKYLSRIPHYRAEPVLRKLNIPFKHVKDYATEDPETILEIEKPDILVVTQVQDYIVRFFMQAAQRKGIPVLLVQDAIFTGDYRRTGDYIQMAKTRAIPHKLKLIAYYTPAFIAFLKGREYSRKEKFQIVQMRLMDVIKGRRFIWGHGEYTKVAVIGNYMRDVLVSEGIDALRIVVTGEPRWDELVSLDDCREEVFQDLGLDTDKKLILVTTQPLVEAGIWTKEERRFWLSTIIQAVDSLNECQLVVKVHPRDIREAYEEIVRDESATHIPVCQDFDISRLLKAGDVLLTHLCTTALEATIMDKPVIIVDFKEDPCSMPFVSSGAAIGVHDPEELTGTIERILYDQETREQYREAKDRYVYHHAYIQDGQASKRVADLIMQMIAESRGP